MAAVGHARARSRLFLALLPAAVRYPPCGPQERRALLARTPKSDGATFHYHYHK